MDRRTFDTELAEFFPGAVVSREEFKSGWIDTIEIGEISVEIAVRNATQRGSLKGVGVGAYIRAKSETKGSFQVWRHQEDVCNVVALRKVLKALKKKLLGMAAAITQMCGFGESGEPKEVEEEFDLSELEEYLNQDKPASPEPAPPKTKDIDKIVGGILGEEDDEEEYDFSFLLD